MLKGILYQGKVKLDFESTENTKVLYSVNNVSNDEPNYFDEVQEQSKLDLIGPSKYALEMIKDAQTELHRIKSKKTINLTEYTSVKEVYEDSIRLFNLIQ